MIPENVQISTLSNGLTLINVRQPWHSGIHCNAIVKVGSCDEQLERDKGICHFIEHMMFRGSEDYTEENITKMINGKGGFYNAATSYIYTNYYIWTQQKYFGESIAILDNLIFRPLIDQTKMNLERKIILEELAEQKSDQYHEASRHNRELLFPDHNYKYSIIGNEDSLTHITPTRMKEYLRGFYRPQTIVLILCGQLPEQNELEDILYDKSHGFIRKTRASNTQVLDRKFGSPGFLNGQFNGSEEWDNIQSSITTTSYPFYMPDVNKQERITLSVLVELLGRNSNSLMFTQIRRDGALCYQCGANYTMIPDGVGQCNFAIFSRKDNVELANKKLDSILSSVKKGKITEELLTETKNCMLGRMLRYLESGDNFASMIGDAFVCDNDNYRIFPWEFEGLVNQVTKKQVVAVANQMFGDTHSRYTIFNK